MSDRHFAIIVLICLAVLARPAAAIDLADSKAWLVDCTPQLLAEYNSGLVAPTGNGDPLLCFLAYVSNFDGLDDDNHDGVSDLLRIPHWVIQRVKIAAMPPETLSAGRLSITKMSPGLSSGPRTRRT